MPTRHRLAVLIIQPLCPTENPAGLYQTFRWDEQTSSGLPLSANGLPLRVCMEFLDQALESVKPNAVFLLIP